MAEAISEQLFTNLLGSLWKTATGTLSGVAKEKLEEALSAKGMRDNALALENFGAGLPDPTITELGYLREAMMEAGKIKMYLQNIILILAWPITLQEGKEEKKEKDEDEKNPVGFTAPSKKKGEKGKKAKWSGRIRALCHGAEDSAEIYERFKIFGLLDSTPNGAVDQFFAFIKREAPDKWEDMKKFGIEAGKGIGKVASTGYAKIESGVKKVNEVDKKWGSRATLIMLIVVALFILGVVSAAKSLF